MKAILYLVSITLCSSLALSACQTAPKLAIDNIVTAPMPILMVSLDSDGDGYSDEIDLCPGTPRNIVTDERGCPFTGMGIGLKMEYRAFFAKGSSELSKEYQLELDTVALKLQEYYTATMRIEGHASVDEMSDTKLRPNSLARNRALIVKNYLVLKHKIDPERLNTFNYDAEQPITSSDTEEGKSMNRRVYGVATADFDSEEEMSMNRRIFEIAVEPED
ncbi:MULTISPECIES: OmpA family protein [Psychrobacter]|uniref:OmpA/MotB n=1 Tax=Psychrobacter cryohalolentis (strain ATCC BAA-1226 / DSM 17306 / VKM B-2378 / K5) TaxID=335284 RepID=Q1QD74_PSYCK|nr:MULTISPECIES: OmpA family protein [Psychrobacter]ABE74379.1 OmpA/MotB [Psychrobacter cryohalolentis K5]ASE27008.1 OmpA family protein [Psychrobacter cryohalolentis]|tara:strand:- start:5032 stop:5688 length:657 start_codon:yes stop_codon:yes gene_type:complete